MKIAEIPESVTTLAELRVALRLKLLSIINSELDAGAPLVLSRETGCFDLPCQFGDGTFNPVEPMRSPIAEVALERWGALGGLPSSRATTADGDAEKTHFRSDTNQSSSRESESPKLVIRSESVEIHLHLPTRHAER